MNKDPLIEKFFNVVDDAIALNYARQLKFSDHKNFMAAAHWLEEYGTVDINVGRQSGKSLYINERATPVDLVLCMNEEHKRHIFKNCNASVNTARELSDVIQMAGPYRGCTAHRKDIYWNKVYVDEPYAVFSRNYKYLREEFYSLIGNHCNQVIMIGTAVR